MEKSVNKVTIPEKIVCELDIIVIYQTVWGKNKRSMNNYNGNSIFIGAYIIDDATLDRSL